VTTRLLLGAAGLAAAAYGLLLLDDRGTEHLPEILAWLVTGVLLHDALLAPAVLVVCAAGGRWLPGRLRGPAIAGALVLGSLTLLAIPVLGRFGERPDNASLLDRDYTTGWLVVAGLTLAMVLVLVAGERSRADRGRRRDGEE
jgi:hypothetical protein